MYTKNKDFSREPLMPISGITDMCSFITTAAATVVVVDVAAAAAAAATTHTL